MLLNKLIRKKRMQIHSGKVIKAVSLNRNRKGFSMIEMLTVMAIVGILSAIMVPKYVDTVQGLRLLAAGEKMVDDLKYIYNYAITQHDTTWMVVDIPNNRYAIFSGPTVASRTLLYDPSTNDTAYVELDTFFPGIKITSVNFGGSSEVMFDWWGTPSSGGTIELDSTYTITVVAETGYIYGP